MKCAASFIIASCVIFYFPYIFADDSFGGFDSQHSELKGYYIVDVGNATEIEPPFGKRWEKEIYQLNGRCFTIDSYRYQVFWGYSGKAGLLLVNERRNIRLALFEKDISNLKVKFEPITLVECPRESGVMRTCATQEECTERLKQLEKQAVQQRKKTEELIKQFREEMR